MERGLQEEQSYEGTRVFIHEPTEQFGAPQSVMPGDEAKAPIPILDMSMWKNATVLVDNPKRWTSFDVCNKLRNATFKYPW